MPVFRLDKRLLFPRADKAEEDGLLAVGGDLGSKRLLLAYASGIFPWYEEGMPILWHSPDPRMVLRASEIHIPRSLRRTIGRGTYEIRLDTAFADVIEACGRVPRPGQEGTWITEDMKRAYLKLHQLGYAHSAEAWRQGHLVGGLYGVSLGGAFFGESMFALEPDASKVAFAVLAGDLARRGIELIDCQVYTDHMARFGATLWSRRFYLERLTLALREPTRRGKWRLESSE